MMESNITTAESSYPGPYWSIVKPFEYEPVVLSSPYWWDGTRLEPDLWKDPKDTVVCPACGEKL